jgi:hypothetical protein
MHSTYFNFLNDSRFNFAKENETLDFIQLFDYVQHNPEFKEYCIDYFNVQLNKK